MIIYAGVIYTGCALYGMGYIIKEKKVLLFRKDLQMTELKEDENYYYCDFKETYYALDLTINEFENYLIGLTYK